MTDRDIITELDRLHHRATDLRACERKLADAGENDPASDTWKTAAIVAASAECDFHAALVAAWPALSRQVGDANQWRARESETQEALQAIGEEFGVRGGEPRVDGIRRVLTEQRTEIAKLREAGEGWRPIESAPHNVLVLLAWRDRFLPQWSYEAGFASHGTRYPGGASSMSLHGQATHWRPLPSPPATGGEDGEG